MNKLNLESKDMISNNIELISQLFPHCITEQNGKKVVDFNKLKDEFTDEIASETKEKYELNWPGKRTAINEARVKTNKTLLPLEYKSVNFKDTNNVYIEGDNLEVLKLLQESYLNKIKCIYIDPPYNTGKKNYIYDDNFYSDKKKELIETNQIDELGNKFVTNTDSNGSFHSDWLTMMYPRLKLARNLLREDGVMFISIDDNEEDNLKKICKEIFGEQNYITTFIWKKKSGGGNDSKHIVVDTENIICIAKNASIAQFYDDLNATSSTVYNQSDENGAYSLERLDKQSLGYLESLDFEIKDTDGTIYKVEHLDPENKVARWRWSQEKVRKEFDKLVFKNGKVYTKNYQKLGQKNRNLLVEDRFGRTRTGKTDLAKVFGKKNLFTAPKPVSLLSYLINITLSDEEEIILDFFSGSATTAQAVMQNNIVGRSNKYILVQLDADINLENDQASHDFCIENDLEPIIPSIAQERIKRAGAKIKEETGADIDYGFRVFKLSDSILKANEVLPNELQQELLFESDSKYVEGISKLDIVTSVILDLGLMLDSKIKELDNDNFVIEEDLLFISLSEVYDKSILDSIRDIMPDQVVLDEKTFDGNDALMTNVIQQINEISSDITINIL